MDKAIYDEVVKRLQEVDNLVSSFDPAVRAEAFSVLRPYVVEPLEGESRRPSGRRGVSLVASRESDSERALRSSSDRIDRASRRRARKGRGLEKKDDLASQGLGRPLIT